MTAVQKMIADLRNASVGDCRRLLAEAKRARSEIQMEMLSLSRQAFIEGSHIAIASRRGADRYLELRREEETTADWIALLEYVIELRGASR